MDTIILTNGELAPTKSNGIKIGWDIGIKNMSYCRVKQTIPSISNVLGEHNSSESNESNDSNESNESNNSMKNIIKIGSNMYQIVGWEIINVVPKINQIIYEQGEITLDTRPIVKCSARKTTTNKQNHSDKKNCNDNVCGKPATHCVVNNPTIGYCNTHYPAEYKTTRDTVEILPTTCRCWYNMSDNTTPTTHTTPTTPTTVNRCQTGAVILSAKNPYVGYCKKHVPMSGLLVSEQLKIIRKRKVASLNLTMLSSALYDELDARPAILYADDVLLENQPVLKNPTMKTMQTFLYSYYVLRGIQSPRNNIKTVGEIHCYCASNKLDIIKLLPQNDAINILRKVKDVKSGYTRNKKLAVLICQYLLDHGTGCEELALIFTDKKKQDDLADSLLMTIHFFERVNLTQLRTQHKNTGAKTKAKTKSKSKTTNPETTSNICFGTEIDICNNDLLLLDEHQLLISELLPKRGGGKKDIKLNNSTSPSIVNKNGVNLTGKISVNLDSPPVSDSSLSDRE